MKRINRKFAWGAAAVLILAMVLSITSFVISSRERINEDRENDLRAVASFVNSSVTNSFVKPITVAKSMSVDVNLRNYLKKAESDPEAVEDGMTDYLTSLKDGLGYNMMFAVCDSSGAYFTCDGISSYIDKSYTGNSEWYGVFMESGKEWDLDVDTEQSTGWALSVFVNQLVRDEDKNILGVCGTALEMTQLQNLIETYERIYDVKIDVTDETGLIQIDTDGERIEKDSVALPDLTLVSDGQYYFEKLSDGDRVIVYMEDIDMYLVVKNNNVEIDEIMPYLKMPLIFTLAGILAAFSLLICASSEEEGSHACMN